MRVCLYVSDHALEDTAENAWRAFLEASPISFDDLFDSPPQVEVQAHFGMPPRAIANATLVLPGVVTPGHAEFCLSNSFFQRTSETQSSILLHEGIHVRLYLGRLRDNYRLIREQPRFCNLLPGFELDRLNLSEEMLTFVQEVGVDKFIASAKLTPELLSLYFDQRAWFYTNGEANDYDDVRSPSLAIYRSFYRLLRAELGLAVTQDPKLRERLAELQRQYMTRLREDAGDRLPWFDNVRRKLLSVTVDTEEPYADPYRELFDRIRDLPVPA